MIQKLSTIGTINTLTTKCSVMNLKMNSEKIGSLTLNYDIFKNVCMDAINKHVPLKMRYIRANHADLHG